MLQVVTEKAEEPLGYRQWSFVHPGGGQVRLALHRGGRMMPCEGAAIQFCFSELLLVMLRLLPGA